MIYFSTYEWCKTRLEERKLPSAVTHLASASAGAVISAFVRVPTDTIKHRVQAYMETDVFLVSLFQMVFESAWPLKAETQCQVVPVFSACKSAVCSPCFGLQLFWAAGTWMSLCVLQARGRCILFGNANIAFADLTTQQKTAVPDKETMQGARHIIASEGVRGLYQGLLPTLLRDVPEIAIQFSLYEK